MCGRRIVTLLCITLFVLVAGYDGAGPSSFGAIARLSTFETVMLAD